MFTIVFKPLIDKSQHTKIWVLLQILLLTCVASAVQAADPGSVKWVFPTNAAVYSSPAIGGDGTIYFGAEDGKFYAVKPDGTQKWVFLTYGPIYSSPAISNGVIYVGSDDGNVYAINSTGTKKWSFQTGERVKSSPAIGPNSIIYVGTDGGKLHAINPDGKQRWAFQTGGKVDSSPAIGPDGTIYVGSADGYLYAINPNGTQKWAFQTNGEVHSSPAIGPDSTIYVGSADGYLYAVKPDGTQKWAFPAGDIPTSPTIGHDGSIYVSSPSAGLFAIYPNGTQKCVYPGGTYLPTPPTIGADGVIYTNTYYDLWAFTSSCVPIWVNDSDVTASSAAIGSDGTVYVGGSEYGGGVPGLHAYNSTSKGLAKTSWPMFRHDNKHTGRLGSLPLIVGGSVVGVSPQTVVCTNQTTSQTVQIPLNGPISWDCKTAGLTVKTGDIIVQEITGPAQ